MKLILFSVLAGVMYYFGAFIGINITSLDNQISLIWPPNAFLLSALLISSPKHWPLFIVAVFVAELAADMPHFSFTAASLFALVNIIECALIAIIIRKMVNIQELIAWTDPQKVLIFIISILFVVTPLSALGGAAVNLYIVGLEKHYFDLWRLWWLGDATGLLVLTPICINFIALFRVNKIAFLVTKQAVYFLGVCLIFFALWISVFLLTPSDAQFFAIAPFLVLLPIAWDILRLDGQQKIMLASALAFLTAILTSFHIGPFIQDDIQTSVLLAQEFILIFISITCLVSAYHSQAFQKSLKLKIFQSTFESVREGIVITEAENDQKIVFCNSAFEKLSAYSAAEIIGQNCRFLNRNYRDQENLLRIKDAISKKEAVEAIVLNTNKQGEDFWNSLSITPIKDDNGKVTHFSGIQFDITDKVSASQILEEQILERTKELSNSQERLELATAVSGLGIWEWDLNTGKLVWDARMHEIYDTPESVKQSGLFYEFWSQSVHPEDIELAAATLNQAVEKRQKWDAEFRLKLPCGEIKFIKATAAIKMDPDGEPIKVIGGNVDITKQRILEEQLKESVEEAKNANTAKSEFLANMSHEIRTPMNGVIGMAELMRGTELSTRQKEYVGMIESSAKSLLLLLNDILDLSKIEAGQFSLDPIPSSLDDCVGDIMKGFAVTAHNKNLELHYYIHPNVPACIKVDRLRLGQILFNLVGNAVKFTNAGEVVVELSSNEANLVAVNDQFNLTILIRDTGIGIAEEKQTDIFKPFQQADNSVTRKFGGTGLGLPIVVHLVRLMGGEISLKSKLGKGTQIELVIPVQRCSDEDLSIKPIQLSSTLNFSNLRILAVDDNLINQRWLKDMAQSWGCRIDIASSVNEGLVFLEKAEEENDPVSILLTDKNMPDLSGFDLVEMIPQKGLKKPAVIIMLSSSELESDVQIATQLGIEEFILKPVKQSEVFNAILNALDQKIQKEVKLNPEQREQALRSLDILVAEDNIVNQRVVNDILASRGHKITLVDNGLKAVNCVEKHLYDVILMDVQMPEMDGFEATKRIRKLQEGSDQRTRIIGVTAHALKGDKELGLEIGMDSYVTKPVFADQLIKAVEQTLYDLEVSPSNSNLSLKKLKFFDKDKALLVTGNDHNLLVKMSQMTLELLSELLERVDQCVVSKSETEMKTHLHKLTGMVANLCSHELVEQLKLLESNLNTSLSVSNEKHWLKLRTNIDQFKDEIIEFLDEV